jgi:predicted nucleic acid-binding Zn ribbon protein
MLDLNLPNPAYTLANALQKMDRLIKTLPAILKASGAAPEVAEAACIAAWRHAVGQGLSDHAAAVQLQNQTLIVVVADDIWKRQLEQMRGQLLFKLNSVLGQPLVKFIELRIDQKKINATRPTPGTLGISPGSANTGRQIPRELLTAAAGIEDAQLRRAFLGAATSCVNRLEKTEI